MTASVQSSLAFVALGWLLGLLGPVITDGIKRRRENHLAKEAMRAELHEVAHKLALAAHYIDMHEGTVTKESLQWLKTHLEGYAGIHSTEPILESMRLQLSWSDDQLAQYIKSDSASHSKGVVLQKYGVPMLDSRISALWSLENQLQRQLLEIRTKIDLLNDLVDRSRFYSDMTFSKLENGNYALVLENIEQVYREYAKRARALVEETCKARSLL